MSFTNWHRAIHQVHQIQEETSNKKIHDQLVVVGMGKTSKASEPRVANPNKISDADFIKLLKSTFEGVDTVRIIKPGDTGSKSRTYNTFVFLFDGAERSVVLSGTITGRGSKATEAQEVSWLLALSALYDDNTINDDESLKEAMMKPIVYTRVYGTTGNALNESGALGLVQWLFDDKQISKGWVTSHLGQSKAFIGKYKNTPAKFIKDRANIPIVQLAKSIFSTSVPDQEFDKDKWNPADVWLEYEDVPSFSTLTQLNNYLEDSIKGSKGIIGISLKLGTNSVTRINMKGERPEYEVTDFDLKFGDLFAQNVPAEYEGTELSGYSVTYRVFDAKATSLIRGEAQKKKSLAAHGKVFLKYLDYLMGGKARYVATVEAVKGKLIEEVVKYTGSYNARKPEKGRGMYRFTRTGEQAFTRIKRTWPILRDSDIMEYGKGIQQNYNKLLDEKEFLDYVAEYAHKKKLKEVDMQTRVSVRFQTIRLGTLFAAIKKKSVDDLHRVVLGMLLYGKSESSWSAPHVKAQ